MYEYFGTNADEVRYWIREMGLEFPILPDAHLDVLKKKYSYSYMERVDAEHSAVRFCTSWCTRPEHVDELIADIRAL